MEQTNNQPDMEMRPTERKVKRTTWWSRNKKWVIGLIILQVVLYTAYIVFCVIKAYDSIGYY